MPDILSVHADAQPETPAVIVDASGGARPSATDFRTLNALVNRAAHGFVAIGAQPRDRMVWCGPNSLEVLATVHAARKASLTAVPLSYRFNAEEMAYVIDNSDATLVVVDAEQAPLIAEVSHRLTKVRAFLVFGGDVPPGFRDWDEVLAGQPDTEPTIAAPETAGASMIYTSGTTGRPKGALRTRTDQRTVFALLGELNLQPGAEVHVTTGPLYHSGPLAWASMNHSLGCPVIVLRKFDPVAWLRLVAEHRVTNTFSAPTQLKRIVSLAPGELARADLSSMRSLVADAAPVPYALKQEVIEKLGDGFLYEVYGSTELGVVTVLHPDEQLRKPGSCGRTYGNIEVRIVNDDGTNAAVREPGELFIRTRLGMDGYHRTDEQLTELDEGDWRSVGDVAYLDEEGYVYICDRKKDMIISGGVNIYPAEIEAALYEHPQILDVAVFGIPDEEWGERVHAVVQPKPGQTIEIEELRTFAAARLARYMQPRDYELRDELPRTEAGKLLKRVLRDEYWRDRDRAV
ncbi:MAG TPA: AMP-binding protein [Acidimicrobiia bacterium]|jgi:acyl-CoA synthetase (AMP-forming)/AMP-acid ligase II